MLALSVNILNNPNPNVKRIKLLQRSYAMKTRHIVSAGLTALVAFVEPPGIEMASIDSGTLTLATPYCIDRFNQAFIFGTAPVTYCPIHGFGSGFFLSEDVGGPAPVPPPVGTTPVGFRGSGDPVARPLPAPSVPAIPAR
jgi:hypothetical protein